jgi:hypothetical protein
VKKTSRPIAPLVERFLPDVVDALREAAAIGRAAEEELATRANGNALVLMLEQEAPLHAVNALLRAMRYAQDVGSAVHRPFPHTQTARSARTRKSWGD